MCHEKLTRVAKNKKLQNYKSQKNIKTCKILKNNLPVNKLFVLSCKYCKYCYTLVLYCYILVTERFIRYVGTQVCNLLVVCPG